MSAVRQVAALLFGLCWIVYGGLVFFGILDVPSAQTVAGCALMGFGGVLLEISGEGPLK